MIDLDKRIKNLIIDPRYASVNNFMHREMYPSKTNFSFLRLPVAKALNQVQEKLKQKGLGLKIFDAYRPYDVTKKFWELVHDERYVANPAKGSGHNRGIAVDLTIIDLQTKQELNMGTDFDNFSDSAHHSFTNFSQQILDNRKLLTQTMQQFGFIPLETEWWHYSWPNAERFEILNLSFKELKKISN
ncbi:MAG: M15 family metallopeptidase [Bacteroidota bacterium]|nr:M15 family metallopeptidase [Bacteroidota bacterium]